MRPPWKVLGEWPDPADFRTELLVGTQLDVTGENGFSAHAGVPWKHLRVKVLVKPDGGNPEVVGMLS
ncbi:MAG: hypothetical protein JWO38_5421 [Gemmataceae bacterium]|nr:hypothetical protein [Gemmataceae bacterium]